MDNRKLTDKKKSIDVGIDKDTIKEPDFQYDRDTGIKDYINSGNDKYSKGDQEQKPPPGEGAGSRAGNKGSGEDSFSFSLSKEEFLDLYFEDMELPDFVKESMAGADKFKFKRSGYTKDGIPARLNTTKTMQMAMARRIAAKAQGKKKPAYIDDVDTRYDHITKKPYPITKAVMFCIMDVSGSMGEKDKRLAKKFFMLLYLFLEKAYDFIEVRFIRHTQDAQEVDEDTFFYHRATGGTEVSSAFVLVNDIIDKEIDLSTTNIYIAQASDGDNWPTDNEPLQDILKTSIFPKIQYMAYIQTRRDYRLAILLKIPDLYSVYLPISKREKKLNIKCVEDDKDVYPVLRELFERAK
jgi:uncharacterized sporulation protein YeaH/YhbH (DUF444 family)